MEKITRYIVVSIALVFFIFSFKYGEAARLAIVGFEGGIDECATTAGTLGRNDTIKNSGVSSVRINPIGTAVGNCGIRAFAASGIYSGSAGYSVATAYYKFAFRADTIPTSTEEIAGFRGTDNVNKATARINAD